MEFVPMVVLSALIKKLMDFAKYAANGDVNAVITQVCSWAAGILVAFVAANSDFGDAVAVNGMALGSLNGWSLAIVGVTLASTAGIGWDTLKAIDSSNSAVVPNLLGASAVRQPGAPPAADPYP